jgi:hypothetical protein
MTTECYYRKFFLRLLSLLRSCYRNLNIVYLASILPSGAIQLSILLRPS